MKLRKEYDLSHFTPYFFYLKQLILFKGKLINLNNFPVELNVNSLNFKGLQIADIIS